MSAFVTQLIHDWFFVSKIHMYTMMVSFYRDYQNKHRILWILQVQNMNRKV